MLVASFDPTILRSAGLEILRSLWDHDISAELASSAQSPDDWTAAKNRDDTYSWIVIIKQDMLKVKTLGKKDDVDIPPSQLLNWLRGEIRERDSRTIKFRGTTAPEQPSADKDYEQRVQILVAQTKSKKL